ncbi:MAG: hypothetical protein QM802_20240 [Agriterribacter sp.]
MFLPSPMMPVDKPNSIEVQTLTDIDYIGASCMTMGQPGQHCAGRCDSNDRITRGLHHPSINGKWIKRSHTYVPDAMSASNLNDSIIAYAYRLGFEDNRMYD